MIRMIKIGDLVYENIEPYFVDENGNKVWIVPSDEEQLKDAFIDTLNWITDRYFYEEANKRGGYKNMGEIMYDAQEGDSDAIFLKSLYDAVWNKEEELENKVMSMSFEELLSFDVKKFAYEAYDEVKATLGK